MTSYDMAAPGLPAYRDLNVLRWLAAYTASVMGDVVYFLVLSWSATRATGPSQAGLVIAAGALPRAVLMLGGGVLADRFGPHRVAVASDATRCVVILAAAVSVVLMPPSLWLLVPVALVFGVVDAVFMPAVGALPPRITAPEQLARVQGMRGLSIRLSNAVGPLLAGVALAAGGPPARSRPPARCSPSRWPSCSPYGCPLCRRRTDEPPVGPSYATGCATSAVTACSRRWSR